jgi:hypothetical protein
MADSVEKMSLANAYRTREHERAVRRVAGADTASGTVGESVALDHRKGLEGEARVEVHGWAGGSGRRLAAIGRWRAGWRLSPKNLEGDGDGAVEKLRNRAADQRVHARPQPLNGEVRWYAYDEMRVLHVEADGIAEPGLEVGAGDLKL